MDGNHRAAGAGADRRSDVNDSSDVAWREIGVYPAPTPGAHNPDQVLVLDITLSRIQARDCAPLMTRFESRQSHELIQERVHPVDAVSEHAQRFCSILLG